MDTVATDRRLSDNRPREHSWPFFMRKPKPQGRGIVKALGQSGTTGNFAKIAKAKGKGAAIAALQNKLAKRRGQPIPFHRGKKKKEYDFSKAEKRLGMKY